MKTKNLSTRILSTALAVLLSASAAADAGVISASAEKASASPYARYVRVWDDNRITYTALLDEDFYIPSAVPKIPYPSDGNLSQSYFKKALNDLRLIARCSVTRIDATSYNRIVSLYDENYAQTYYAGEKGDISVTSDNSLNFPLDNWQINEIGTNYVKATMDIDPRSAYGGNVMGYYDDVYFKSGRSSYPFSYTFYFDAPKKTPTSVTVKADKTTISVGDTVQCTATVLPADAEDKSVLWFSSNTAVATVNDHTGLVTAVGEGTAWIYAITNTGNIQNNVCIKVSKKDTGKVTLNKTSLSLKVGESFYFSYMTEGGAVGSAVTFTSSDPSVASVTKNGALKALKAGKVTITASSSTGATAYCEVTVTDNSPTGIYITPSTLNMKVGEKYAISATVLPYEADQTVKWSIIGDGSVKLGNNGIVTAVKEGTSTVYIKSVNGLETSCKITVASSEKPVTSVSLNKTIASMKTGESISLSASISPSDATDKTLTWSTNNSSVASVDSYGNVTAKNAGTATITVKTKNGKTAICQITVTAAEKPVTSISLNKTSASMKTGESLSLSASVYPTDATDKTVTWSTNNSSVASVDSYGNVTAKSAGTATITVKTKNGKTATCQITVTAVEKPVTSISLNKTSVSMKTGESLSLSASVYPTDATDKTVTWSTNNYSVASVDSYGNVTAKNAGTATITVKTKNGKTASCQITVTAAQKAVTSITLNKTSATIKKGEYLTLKATVSPDDASDKSVKWTTSSSYIATVSANGQVRGYNAGKVTITATTSNGKTATCTVTVSGTEPTGISLNKSSLTLKAGQSETLTATVTPSDADNKSVTWKSSNTSVVTVSSDGQVKAVKAGSATVTASTPNGKTASCTVKVEAAQTAAKEVTKVTLNQTSCTLDVDSVTRLKAYTTPSDVTTTLTWSSSNSKVVTVDNNGRIDAISAGTATITVRTANGKTASCVVTVTKSNVAVSSVTLDKKSAALNKGETLTLTATVSPINATDKTIKWSSSSTSVAAVDSSGTVTAKGAGTATITAKTSNGKNATCTVTVKVVPKLTFKQSSINVYIGETTKLPVNTIPAGYTAEFKVVNDVNQYSSNNHYLMVYSNGTVCGIKEGTTYVYGRITGGEWSKIAVNISVNTVKLEAARKQYIEDILYYTNIEREKEGLAPVKLLDDLSYCAQIRSDEMRDANMIISHTRPNGTPFYTVLDEHPTLQYISARENLATGSLSAKETVEMWMNSSDHRKNLLNPNNTYMGVGVVLADNDYEVGRIITQLFI